MKIFKEDKTPKIEQLDGLFDSFRSADQRISGSTLITELEKNSNRDFSKWFYQNYRNKDLQYKVRVQKEDITLSKAFGVDKNIKEHNRLFKEHMFVIAYLFKYKDQSEFTEYLNKIIESVKNIADQDKGDAIKELTRVTNLTDIAAIETAIDDAITKGVDEYDAEFTAAKTKLDSLKKSKAITELTRVTSLTDIADITAIETAIDDAITNGVKPDTTEFTAAKTQLDKLVVEKELDDAMKTDDINMLNDAIQKAKALTPPLTVGVPEARRR